MPNVAELYGLAESQLRSGSVVKAELLFREVLELAPRHVPTRRWLADLAERRGDVAAAADMLVALAAENPSDADIALHAASSLWRHRQDAYAVQVLRQHVQTSSGDERAWLLLGEVLDEQGDTLGALRARQQAFSRAHRAGRWLSESSTEAALRPMVSKAARKFAATRRDHLYEVYAPIRSEAGAAALARVDRALAGYIGDLELVPSDARQRPKFLYVPDLPPGPFHDPLLHGWATRFQSQWRDIQAEALAVIRAAAGVRSFLDFKPGDPIEKYVTGEGYGGTPPSWDAFFFYRRGRRFDENHIACPRTSEALETIDLCRIDNQTPEVCFSLLPPGSHIVAHHGTTNSRLVMHLGLIVPPDCALNVVGEGQRHCGEGELLLFDDTFLHEAWNRSDRLRAIVLMDCWNPHLTPPEQEALRLLVQAIDSIENSV